MDSLECMKQRHSVRSYLDKAIEPEKREALGALIEDLNRTYGTNVQIFYDDPNVFKNADASYGVFKGCKNYVLLVGRDAEKCGYVGEILALKAQEMGLNTCFVALTYKKGAVKNKVRLNAGEKIQCNLAIGYGETQGVSHKGKAYAQVAEIHGEKAENFDAIVEACLLAPTALNQQKFKVVCKDGKTEVKKSGFGFYTDVDLGIVKAHKDLIDGTIEW